MREWIENKANRIRFSGNDQFVQGHEQSVIPYAEYTRSKEYFNINFNLRNADSVDRKNRHITQCLYPFVLEISGALNTLTSTNRNFLHLYVTTCLR